MTLASHYDDLSVTHHWLSDDCYSNGVSRLHIDLSLRWVVALRISLLGVSLLGISLLGIDLHTGLLHGISLLGICTGLLVVHLLLWWILAGRKLSWWIHTGLLCWIGAGRVLTRRHLVGLLAGVARLHI